MTLYKPIILVGAALLLVSCQKESPRSGGGIPMQVEPTLSGDTKGSMTTADLTDFYLQVIAEDPAYNYFEHASKDGSGAWTTTSKMYWKDETSPVTYCAAHFGGYAFTAADFKNGVYLELPQDQSTQESLNAADLLTMPVPDAKVKFEDTTDGTLPVALSHGLAKLTITLTLGERFYENLYTRGANPVEDFTILGTNVAFTFKPQTDEVSALEDTPGEILPLAVSFTPGTAEAKSEATYEAILVPQDLGVGALKVIFCVGDYDYEWSNSEAITLEAGKSYDLIVSVTAAPPLEHAYVDMGNGLLWATCNVGAANPWDYGDYFAWGEIAPKTTYDWTTYTYGSSATSLTKYCTDPARGAEGFTDMLTELELSDDAARQNWGGNWRIPTDAEWTWLRANCTSTWTTQKGVDGLLVTSTVNGNQIFLPPAGRKAETDLINAGTNGYYCSSSLGAYTSSEAKIEMFAGPPGSSGNGIRYCGYSVRPVHD